LIDSFVLKDTSRDLVS